MNIIPKTTIQVKLFHTSDMEMMEQQINEFIKHRDIIDIKYNTIQDITTQDFIYFTHSALVLYKDHQIQIKDRP